MARHIGVAIDGTETVYRGVILYLYPGIHSRRLKTYTTADGREYQYHEANAYGPYGSKAPATAQVSQALRHHAEWVKGNHYTTKRTYNPTTRSYDIEHNVGSIPEVTSFVESQVPSWAPIAGTERTA